ncbi:MAG: DNA polymerase III subunit psi [Chryseolinea sp.]
MRSLENTFAEDLYNIPPKVLVIISIPWNKVKDEDRELLSRILGAVKLSLAGVQIVVLKKFTMADVSIFSPRFIIAFGISLEPAGEIYEVYENEGITMLQSENLDHLDDSRKKKLWKALKQMFNY